MRLSTIVGLLAVVGLSAAAAVGAAFGLRQRLPNGGRPRPVEGERIDSAFARQLAHAARIGLTEAREGDRGRETVRAGAWEHEVEMAAGECAAAVIGAGGCVIASAVELRELPDRRLMDRAGGRVEPQVLQVQWCAWDEAETVALHVPLRIDADCLPEHRGRGVVRWEIRRGPADEVPGPSGLVSLHRLSETHRVAGERAAARGWVRRHPGAGRALGEPRRTRFDDGALLWPASAATCHAAYALANEGQEVPVAPKLDLGEDPAVRCPPEGARPGLPIDPVRQATEGLPDRILAVVDRGDLGAPCVEVTVARLRWGTPPAPVHVRELAEGTERELAPEDGAPFVFRDRSCAGTGLVAYLVPANDHADYRLEMRSVRAPQSAVAHAAPPPEGPFPTARPVPAAARAKARRCEARRDAAACLELAQDHRQGRDGVPQDLARAAQLFERACALGATEGCTYLAHAYDLGEGVTEDDAEAERRYREACEAGSALACAYAGDFERRTAGAPVSAMRRARNRYARACDAGVESACRNRNFLQQLDLL
jgi:hypothetical protein